jgi:uncharacterized protein (TIGR02001 family)
MNKNRTYMHALWGGAVLGAACFALAGSAQAADLYGSYKDGPVEEAAPAPDYSISVNGGLTTDYVFRGFSQSDEDPAAFVGADFSYQWFYAGVWASSVDDFASDGNVEVDIYAGIKKSWSGIDLDLGVLYYGYPGDSTGDAAYFEIKAAAGTTIAETLALTGSVYYSPEYTYETGEVWTVEGKASAPLPIFELSLSGTVGHVISEDDFFEDYTYWNVGLSKTFLEHFTLDVRYWDTDVEGDDLADERFVGTISFAY